MTEDERSALLADMTPWTLADVVRELGLTAREARDLAWNTQMAAARGGAFEPARMLPRPLPGSPTLRLTRLHRCAEGNRAEDQPLWAAGDIRRWGMQTAHLDHELNIRQQPPQPTRRRGTPGWSQ
jgi:hypothetical protein